MERRRYESPLFTVGMFVLIISGLMACAIDPTGLAGGNGMVVSLGALSGMQLVLFGVGATMIIIGLVIRTVAIVNLGSNFSGLLRIREGHTLVKSGIYRWVRHPAYLGAILIFLGIPVMVSSILGFVVMSLLVPYLLHRIRLEERMMIGRFGAEYEEYMRHSKRLIPFVY